ncbi:membrane-bound lytic murein transglycosylase MltF [uncultured Desulfobacter sp.]|uniref:membrane-bound lytic murein transglycosylase MltF n=1 Tax=uncultured Desulfobacter sp. TaxID=240139 RepID=UPI0029F5AEA8|nr:membrane-bound lytic murein transglycosylase MltF [uncultured Desulfobacter sp.]
MVAAIGIGIYLLFDQMGFRFKDPLKQIQTRGTIRMITANTATSYYTYRDSPMGFEYDLAKAFADHLGVTLEVIVPDWNSMFEVLNSGQGDFIAAGITITKSRERIALFSDSYMPVQQKFIHHKLKFGIKNLEQLAGRTIYVRKGTSYQERLEELKASGIDLTILPLKDVATEEFIRLVSEKKIKYTIADSNIALLNRRYYPDIIIGLPIQEEEHLGWAVKKTNRGLRDQINEFLEMAEETGIFAKLYEKYYGNVEIFDYFDLKKFHERIKTRLPEYKKMIKKESEKYGFDWRLIAAMVYQESHFNAKAKSRTGVRGLMQVTQETARRMGIKNRLDPKQSVKAGVKFFNMMHKRFNDIPDPRQKKRFALAAYNVGYGHVRDAQEIARQQGMDINKWTSLKKTLPLLSKRKYYEKTRYGYARGQEPVHYVERIFTYYDILRQKKH